MKIKDIALSAAYVGQRVVKAICVGAQEIWSAIKYIVFKDPVVAQICAENWGDGTGLSEEQAASVTDIGTVFKGNTEITSFNELAEFTGLKAIAIRAFYGSSLQSVTIPSSVEIVYSEAFHSCANLTTVNGLGDVKKLSGTSVFYNCPLNGYVRFKYLTEVTNAAFYKSQFSSIIFDKDISAAGSLHFDQNNALVSVVVPNGSTIMPSFGNCPLLSEFDLSDRRAVVALSPSFLRSCTSLIIEDLCMPNLTNRVTPQRWFGDGTQLKKISNLGKVTGNFTESFHNCKQLVYAVMPYTLSNASSLYAGCTALEVAIFHAIVPPTLGGASFYKCNKLVGIYVPDESVEAYKTAANWSSYSDRISSLLELITFTDITSSLVSDIAYNTALEVYAQFDNTAISETGAKSMIYDLDGSYDTLKITGNGGTTSRLYCFIDESNEVITTADASLTAAPLYICIPSMARKMVICCAASSTNVKVEIGKPK